MKRKSVFILILLSVISALCALPTSGALSNGNLDRATAAQIASSDATAALKLEGIHGSYLTISNVNKKYFYLGTITNNSSQPLDITLSATPDFSKLTNKNYWLGIQAGNTIEFTSSSAATQSLQFTLAPGAAQTINGALMGNQAREVIVSFAFTATNAATGTYISVKDTDANPRRVYLK